MMESAKVTIFRFNPQQDREPRYETYDVPPEGWEKVKLIDTLRYIYENFAPDLAFREPCRHQICGACTILLNKKPVIACDTLSEKEMLIEPLTGHRVLRDLIIETAD